MSIHSSYTIIPELGLVLTYSQGKMQIADLLKLSTDIFQDPAYNISYDLIWDLRASTALGYKMDILEYLEFLKKNLQFKNRVRSGILLSTPNQKFLLSIFKPIAKLNKIDAEYFTEIDKCLKWMGYSESQQMVVNDALAKMKAGISSLPGGSIPGSESPGK